MNASDDHGAAFAEGAAPTHAPSPEDYLEEAEFLWLQRRSSATAPHVSFQSFADEDELIAAQIDGLLEIVRRGGSQARAVDRLLVATQLFSGHVVQLLSADARTVNGSAWDAEALDAWINALAWVPPDKSESVLARLHNSEIGNDQFISLSARCLRRELATQDIEAALRAQSARIVGRALCAVGEMGAVQFGPQCRALLRSRQLAHRMRAACSLVLLGDAGDDAFEVLTALADLSGPVLRRALFLLCIAGSSTVGHGALQALAPGFETTRLRIGGCGWMGDPKYVPWLLDQLTDPATARIAFEAFVTICGPDINAEQMESMPPEGYDDGPNDDPDDDNVELPEDIALPWPDVARVKAWWMQHRAAFQPDTKLFLGRPPSVDWCRHVLRTGFQRQRVQAAQHLCLVAPGQPLFPTSAPAWRQQRLMAAW